MFPRVIVGPEEKSRPRRGATRKPRERLSIGVKGLDDMLGGGIPAGYSVLVAGPSGSGKSVLASEFISEGARHDEPGIIAVFEKRPNEYSQDGPSGQRFDRLVREGKVGILQTRPLDLSIDEMLNEVVDAIHRLKARRLVIDSLSGFELALAPTFREDFRESLYRMVTVLTGMGITMMMTAEVEDSYTDLRFSPHGTAFLTDAIIMQRYVVLEGATAAHHGRRESARERAQQGPAGVRDHGGRDRDGRDARWLRGPADRQPGSDVGAQGRGQLGRTPTIRLFVSYSPMTGEAGTASAASGTSTVKTQPLPGRL